MDASRRKFAGSVPVLVASLIAGVFRPRTLLAAWSEQAFNAKSLQDALRALGMRDVSPSKDIAIDAPDFAENAALVPVQIMSRIPGTRSLWVFVDRNPWPHIARFDFTPQILPWVSLRLRVAEASPVRAVARAGESYHVATKDVKVAAGGCGGAGDAVSPMAKADPIKMRARSEGEVVTLLALMPHPMENGLRTGPGGNAIPEHFIQNLEIRLNGERVLDAEIGRSISTNPLFGFRFQGVKTNDSFKITWRDNRGLSRTDAIMVSG
jgi:sulfur-oxidizing protein SoxY